jgi:fucose 4-O-acetylase-like acetyltransferase
MTQTEMPNRSLTSRDSFIDNARGVAVLSIIFIHTVFWSGYSYVPEWVRTISLFVDVPLFFSWRVVLCQLLA